MKKIIALALCAMLLCVFPMMTFAEEEAPAAEASMTDNIVNWVTSHIEECTVIGTMVLTILYNSRKNKKTDGVLSILNNNAVSIAENSAKTVKDALAEVAAIAEVVNAHKEDLSSMLEEIKRNAEEKKKLEDTITSVEKLLKATKLANIELSNEVAELLVLANIPNAKKDELYARHTSAVSRAHALGGAPGIFSARYAGVDGAHGADAANNALLVKNLSDKDDKSAHYTCAMALVYPDGTLVEAEGYMYGTIVAEAKGDHGFGYDPHFVPDGETRTVAQMSDEEKNSISHRASALKLLLSKI